MAHGYNYSIHLLCWSPKQFNVIHDHNGSWSFFKVLEGTLQESRFELPDLCHTSKPMLLQGEVQNLLANEVVVHSPRIIHSLANPSDTETVYSLHVYSPPLKQCCGYDPMTSAVAIYDCDHHLTQCPNPCQE